MRSVWCVAVLLATLVAGPAIADEANDVECSKLERIKIAQPESYDEVYCMAASRSGLSAGGETRGPVGGPSEMIVAISRATFAVVRFDGTNHHTYIRLEGVRTHIENAMAWLEPRGWGEERKYERFALIDFEGKVMDDSQYLSCVGFMAGLRPAIGGPGYREALAGAYCAMDTLTPTEAEVTAFIDGLEF